MCECENEWEGVLPFSLSPPFFFTMIVLQIHSQLPGHGQRQVLLLLWTLAPHMFLDLKGGTMNNNNNNPLSLPPPFPSNPPLVNTKKCSPCSPWRHTMDPGGRKAPSNSKQSCATRTLPKMRKVGSAKTTRKRSSRPAIPGICWISGSRGRERAEVGMVVLPWSAALPCWCCCVRIVAISGEDSPPCSVC